MFKSGDLKGALRKYHTAILYLKGLDNSQFAGMNMSTDSSGSINHHDKVQIASLLTAVHSNMAAVYLKLGEAEKTIKSSKLALGLSPSHAKSVYRIAMAYKLMGNLDSACKELVNAAKLAPNDVGIRQELETIKGLIKQHDEKATEELKKNMGNLANIRLT